MAVSSAADALLNVVSLVNCYKPIFALKLGLSFYFGLNRSYQVRISAVLMLLFQ